MKAFLMRKQEIRRGIAAVVLLIIFPCGAAAMDHFVPNNAQARGIIGFSLFTLPLFSLALGLKSHHTWLGIVSLFISVPLFLWVVGATFWWFVILQPQVVRYSRLHPHHSTQRLISQRPNNALHPTPPARLPVRH